MVTIRPATIDDAQAILDLTHRAFQLYSAELPAGTPVLALSEHIDEVLWDITKNHVLVATDDTKRLLGAVRWCQLDDRLAYLYRFGVDPASLSTGVGSELLSRVIDDCATRGLAAIALHTNARYFKLARYYYGREFFVHSTCTSKGYIRALFVKELSDQPYDISAALAK